ncbi:MAG: hypothetical protein ACI4RA_00045 [Kiritimatiellia bacterium]
MGEMRRFFLGGFVAAVCALSGCAERDLVDVAFERIQNKYDVFRGHELLASSREWSKAYRVSDSDIEKIVNCDLGEFNYVGWERFRGRRSCGIEPSITVDGMRNHIIWNRMADSDAFDMEAVFLNVDEKVLILFYGRTYGM